MAEWRLFLVLMVATTIFFTLDLDKAIGGITATDNSKGQTTRLFDVFVLGPFMIWYALSGSMPHSFWAQDLLVAAGVFTVLYNGRNYIRAAT